MATPARTGGRLVVDQLLAHGIDLAFCVPGESYLPVLDAAYDTPLKLVTCRHEAGAANMAVAYGKLTGKPGVCLVTRGPGATHASVGVHTAAQDSAPLLLLVGQVPRDQRGREAFQELDVPAAFAPLAKWAAEARETARLPELLARAVRVATGERPGPVVLALPEDVLRETAAVEDARARAPEPARPDLATLERLRELLAAARRPLVIAGGAGWTAAAASDLRAFAEAASLPVAVSFRSQDLIDNRSPAYVGDLGATRNPALGERVLAADLLLVLGPRLGSMTTGGYRLVEPPRPRQRLVHAHVGAAELGRVFQPDLAVHAGMGPLAAALRRLAAPRPAWSAWAAEAREDHLAWARPPREERRGVDLGRAVAHLRRALPDRAVVTNGAGNYAGWLHRHFEYRDFGTQLAPKSGAMGFGLPAAVAARLVHPGRPVVALAGDGCFLMTGQELATAVQERLAVVVLVVNNGMYGTIRQHQERHYPGRPVATDLLNPDFAALARAFGAHGETVESTPAFPGALDRALEAGRPALLDLRVDPTILDAHGTTLP